MAIEPILVAGEWRTATLRSSFRASNPATREILDGEFPVSEWQDCDEALNAASSAAKELRTVPPETLAAFLELYAKNIERDATDLIERAHAETGLPRSPRLKDVELPRTTTQLRQGAAAAREGSWTRAVIDTKANIRSHFAPIGPVPIFGPNNFPFAYNAVAGGDFTAAIATGNPVIAKAHPLQPGTTKLLAECAMDALAQTGLPRATVQMLYHVDNANGPRLVSDKRVGAVGFTGSRKGGLLLKAAADAAGKPIYLEMSSLNPVILLPGALAERGEELAIELADSCLLASGQFCTSPNLIITTAGHDAEKLTTSLAKILEERIPSPLLSSGGLEGLVESVQALISAGAKVVTGAAVAEGNGYRYKNTLLRVSGAQFVDKREELQREAFGNSTMLVIARDLLELQRVFESLDGNLTGSIYSSTKGDDDAAYAKLVTELRFKVGRLLNDKVPTGVALSPAMNHGGPYPSTGHPGFTAVGVPESFMRFVGLHCYDNVRPERLPAVLRDQAPNPNIWRQIDGNWIRG